MGRECCPFSTIDPREECYNACLSGKDDAFSCASSPKDPKLSQIKEISSIHQIWCKLQRWNHPNDISHREVQSENGGKAGPSTENSRSPSGCKIQVLNGALVRQRFPIIAKLDSAKSTITQTDLKTKGFFGTEVYCRWESLVVFLVSLRAPRTIVGFFSGHMCCDPLHNA